MVFVNSVIRVSTKTKADCFPIWKRRTPFMWRCCATDANHRLHIMYIKNLFSKGSVASLVCRPHGTSIEGTNTPKSWLGPRGQRTFWDWGWGQAL
jgi:hypothetical protein